MCAARRQSSRSGREIGSPPSRRRRPLHAQHVEPMRLGEGQAADQHGVDQREHRRVDADAQGERGDGHGAEPAILGQQAQREPQVLQEGSWRVVTRRRRRKVYAPLPTAAPAADTACDEPRPLPAPFGGSIRHAHLARPAPRGASSGRPSPRRRRRRGRSSAAPTGPASPTTRRCRSPGRRPSTSPGPPICRAAAGRRRSSGATACS